MRILLVEDDEIIANNIAALLRKQAYIVECAATLGSAERMLYDESYDLAILDRGLPDGDGLTLVSGIRDASPDTSVLMLTAQNRPDDRVSGLDAGADDYLPKPFVPGELLARVRALLRRGVRKGTSSHITVGWVTVDVSARSVTKEGVPVELSPREYALLEYLLVHRGEAIDRQHLLEHVWGDTADMFSNTVDVHIRYLRKKLDIAGRESLIKTVKGTGYRI